MTAEFIWTLMALAFLTALLGAFAVSRLGFRLSLVDYPSERSSHRKPTPRGGGIGIVLGFCLVTAAVQAGPVPAAAATLMALLGLMEDKQGVAYRFRLFGQFLLGTLAVMGIYGPPASFPGLLLFAFWVLVIAGTANFYNFMDGINGIASLTGIVAFGLTGYFCWFDVHKLEMGVISLALSAGCLGFLPLNFPNARVFMGDTASLFLGFIFAAFLVELSANIGRFFCVVSFMLPFLADAITTILLRFRRGESLAEPHRNHLYQCLANEVGLSHSVVTIAYGLTQLLVGMLAIFAYRRGLAWQVLLIIGFYAVFVFAYARVYYVVVLPVRTNRRRSDRRMDRSRVSLQ